MVKKIISLNDFLENINEFSAQFSDEKIEINPCEIDNKYFDDFNNILDKIEMQGVNIIRIEKNCPDERIILQAKDWWKINKKLKEEFLKIFKML